MTTDALEADYYDQIGSAIKLKAALLEQLEHLFSEHGVSLGVPMEGRVKSWSSIAEKLSRKSLALKAIEDLDDLIGIRVILLFRPDLPRVDKLVRETFNVVSAEDTAKRLSENQFGYQSQHYVLRIPNAWRDIPSFSRLGNLKVEIQVRTLAQHIWAAASHKLQYKHETNVPLQLRRAIHRVSALLETVDLEFERVLDERTAYMQREVEGLSPAEPLNVDIVRLILTELFPAQNRKESEDYAELLDDLTHFGIKTVDSLRRLLVKHMEAVLREDAKVAADQDQEIDYFDPIQENVIPRVYFTCTGLARQALREEFGDEVVSAWFVNQPLYNI